VINWTRHQVSKHSHSCHPSKGRRSTRPIAQTRLWRWRNHSCKVPILLHARDDLVWCRGKNWKRWGGYRSWPAIRFYTSIYFTFGFLEINIQIHLRILLSNKFRYPIIWVWVQSNNIVDVSNTKLAHYLVKNIISWAMYRRFFRIIFCLTWVQKKRGLCVPREKPS
jgi:hypothetical protein